MLPLSKLTNIMSEKQRVFRSEFEQKFTAMN